MSPPRRRSPMSDGQPSAHLLRTFVCLLLFFFACISLAPAADESAAEKLPIPKQPAQAKADHELRERFKADFAKHDAGSDLELARKLRGESDHTDDPATRFVMLKESRELFISAGELEAALAVIDQMAAGFTIDIRDMKLGAMSVAVDKSLIEPPAMTAVYLNLGDRFLDEGDVDMAEHSCRLAQNVMHNHRFNDAQLESRWKEQHRVVMISLRQTQNVIGAVRKLKANPDDPDANLIVGKYACFFRGLWEKNLSLLTKGSDTRLKALADDELKIPASPQAMLAVADGWWAVADTAATPVETRKIHRHAAEWYAKALPQLDGVQKQTAQQRVADSTQSAK